MTPDGPGGTPETWAAPTHVWAAPVDEAHLREARTVGASLPLAHRVLEVVAYADEEAEALGGGSVVVALTDTGVRVDDAGRGTETRRSADGRLIRKPVMSTADVRFFGRADAPLLPDGRARHGMSVVAAGAAELVHENHRAGEAWTQRYLFGVPEDALRSLPFRGHPGTAVTFSADDVAGVDAAALAGMLAGFRHLQVELRDERSATGRTA